MEVTTVSPPHPPPSDGDNLCDTDVTSVAIHTVTLLICLCGLAGNGAVIGLLSLKSGNYSFLALAVVDFLFLLFAVPSSLLFLVEDVSCSPIMPLVYLNFLFQLSVFSCYWVLFQLISTSPVLYMRKLWKLCCRCELPLRLWLLVGSIQYWAFIDFFTVIPSLIFLCSSHEQEQCRAALISMYTLILLLFVAPVVIFHAVNFIKAKWGSQQQQQQKRRDIVIFLIVLFTLLLSIWNLLQQLGFVVVSSQVFFLLTYIHSSIKPFIYFLAGGCWRPCSVGSLQLSLQRVFDEQKKKTSCRNDPAMHTGI